MFKKVQENKKRKEVSVDKMNEKRGYIKTFRSILDNPVASKDNDHFRLWMYIILSATHTDMDIIWNGKPAILKRGQLLTGRKNLAVNNNIQETKVERILKLFETAQQIEQQTTNKNRIITVINYERYQGFEQQNEQRMNNERTTTEQQVNTNKELKELKEHKRLKKEDIDAHNVTNNVTDYQSLLDYFNSLSFRKVKTLTATRKKHLNARLKEYGETKLKELWNKADKNPFMHGENNRAWSANFDWLINQANLVKLEEGNYERNITNKPMSIKERQELTPSSVGIDI